MVQLSTLSGGSSGGSSSSVTGKDGFGNLSKPAKYYILSNNTSYNDYEIAFYDQDFATMFTQYMDYNNVTYPDITQFASLGNSNYRNRSQFHWNSWQSTTSQGPSSNSGYYFAATWCSSNVGHAAIDVFGNGSFKPTIVNYYDKAYLTKFIFNSDHTDKSIQYVLYGNTVKAMSVNMFGQSALTAQNTHTFTFPAADGTAFNTNMAGAASYNNTRKEFIALSHSSSNNFRVWHYKGIDFDTYPNPAEAFTNATTATFFDLTAPSFNSNNNSTHRQLQPVLCDDGTAWLAFFDTNHGLYTTKFVPPTNGTGMGSGEGGSTVNATSTFGVSSTTSYGYEQGINFGMVMVQSTDGKAIGFMGPYYYYGAGCSAQVLSKRSHTGNRGQMQNSNTTYGYAMVPYRDDCITFIRNENFYATNFSGQYVDKTFQAVPTASDGIITHSSSRFYFPHATSPNTTNYVGSGFVNDYHSYPYSDFK